jgi:hypothetical protein
MKALADLLKRIIGIEKKADKFFVEILKDSNVQAQIIDLNLEQMYEGGIDSEGNSLGQYAQITVSYWKPLARSLGNDGRKDHITLKDTGEFYKSFRIKLENDGFRITANAIKEDTDLAQIYPKVIGLSKESKAMVSELITPYFIESIRAQILG